ncbi:hypothetical protein SERLA73DRAFT_178370, partial [Serpula lacrymans var. lacrymans S7.3]
MFIRPCQWKDKPCGMWIGITKARVRAHFKAHHGVVEGKRGGAATELSKHSEKLRTCRWSGCDYPKPMVSTSLLRHIVNTDHFGMKYRCSNCSTDV